MARAGDYSEVWVGDRLRMERDGKLVGMGLATAQDPGAPNGELGGMAQQPQGATQMIEVSEAYVEWAAGRLSSPGLSSPVATGWLAGWLAATTGRARVGGGGRKIRGMGSATKHAWKPCERRVSVAVVSS
jgi:hypothetical protein